MPIITIEISDEAYQYLLGEVKYAQENPQWYLPENNTVEYYAAEAVNQRKSLLEACNRNAGNVLDLIDNMPSLMGKRNAAIRRKKEKKEKPLSQKERAIQDFKGEHVKNQISKNAFAGKYYAKRYKRDRDTVREYLQGVYVDECNCKYCLEIKSKKK